MGAKAIILRPIDAATANELVRRVHYSGNVVRNSQLHIGVFYMGRLEGAMQFGPSLDKRKTAGLVTGSGWHQFTELNRLAFSDALPRNSESPALAVAFRLLARHAPQLKWIISFADGTQCGDGTIYRASGFVLTAIKTSENLIRLPSGIVIHKMTLESSPLASRPELGGRCYADVTGGKNDIAAYVRAVDGTVIAGYQLRYVYFLDPTWRERLTVPVIPFADIPADARMYRGMRGGPDGRPGHHPGTGGSTPTPPLHAEGDPDGG